MEELHLPDVSAQSHDPFYNDENKDETFSSSLVFVHVQSELVLDQ